ncbi:hypothetical protein Hanom_Chr06g00482181 [Helianthus anomalus]
MENKQLFMSALSVGLGVGVGVGMTVSRWTSGGDDSSGMRLTPQTMEREMLSMIVDGKDSKVTFDLFPYYLRYIIYILFFFNGNFLNPKSGTLTKSVSDLRCVNWVRAGSGQTWLSN